MCHSLQMVTTYKNARKEVMHVALIVHLSMIVVQFLINPLSPPLKNSNHKSIQRKLDHKHSMKPDV